MSDTCLNCNGLIMEPGKVYGYAGKVCYCPKAPGSAYQRPARKEEHKEMISKAEYEHILAQEVKRLRTLLEEIREELEDIAADDDEGSSFEHQREQDKRWAREALAKLDQELGNEKE